MRRKSIFIGLRFCADLLTIPMLWLISYGLKFKLNWFFNQVFNQNWGMIYEHAQIEPYIASLGMVTAVWVLSFYICDLYKVSYEVFPIADEGIKAMKGALLATGLLIGVSFMLHWEPISRYMMVYACLIGCLLTFLNRVFILYLEMVIFKSKTAIKTLVLGADDYAQDLTERILLAMADPYEYVGTLDDAAPESLLFHLKTNFRFLGSLDQLPTVVELAKIKCIFLAKSGLSRQEIRNLIEFCMANHILLHIASEYISLQYVGKASLYHGIPVISIGTQSSLPYLIVKRIFDGVFSGLLLLILSPVMGGIALWIKGVSPGGPVIYKQERVTKNSEPFMMFKFRSMRPQAEAQSGPVMVDERNETRYIKGGKFLRQCSLDELPQLWNIFLGQMSFVGPRPERPYFVDEFSKTLAFFRMRHQMKAGLTGWAQVNGRSMLTRQPAQKLKYDMYYIYHASFAFDLKILFVTLFVVFGREESY